MKVNKAQATIEFTMVFVITLLFILLTVNVFVWLNHCMVRRQLAYEETRTDAGSPNIYLDENGHTIKHGNPGRGDFFTTPPQLNIFTIGGGIDKTNE